MQLQQCYDGLSGFRILSPNALKVFCILAECAEGGVNIMTTNMLWEKMFWDSRSSPATISVATNSLANLGLITIENGERNRKIYTLNKEVSIQFFRSVIDNWMQYIYRDITRRERETREFILRKVLAGEKKVTISEIVANTGMFQPNVSVILKKMVERGLLDVEIGGHKGFSKKFFVATPQFLEDVEERKRKLKVNIKQIISVLNGGELPSDMWEEKDITF